MRDRVRNGAKSAGWRVLEAQDPQGAAERRRFANDVLIGLFRQPKSIPCRYFYDERGIQLFQKIMELPQYYLTDCELEIFTTFRESIGEHVSGERFNLVELGAGDGKKTKILLEHFASRGFDFRYVPIDICRRAVAELLEDCGHSIPNLSTEGIVSEYFDGLHWLSGLDDGRTVVLFLGSNIGNFTASESRVFLRSLWNALSDGDLLLIGFDLKKDIKMLMEAYNDPGGVTADFNLNLLRRINRELGGDFRMENFEHYATYDVLTGSMQSYLVSRTSQSVFIEGLQQRFEFEVLEPILTEVSQKYLPSDLHVLAVETGFEIVEDYRDANGWFIDSLWVAHKAAGPSSAGY